MKITDNKILMEKSMSAKETYVDTAGDEPGKTYTYTPSIENCQLFIRYHIGGAEQDMQQYLEFYPNNNTQAIDSVVKAGSNIMFTFNKDYSISSYYIKEYESLEGVGAKITTSGAEVKQLKVGDNEGFLTISNQQITVPVYQENDKKFLSGIPYESNTDTFKFSVTTDSNSYEISLAGINREKIDFVRITEHFNSYTFYWKNLESQKEQKEKNFTLKWNLDKEILTITDSDSKLIFYTIEVVSKPIEASRTYDIPLGYLPYATLSDQLIKANEVFDLGNNNSCMFLSVGGLVSKLVISLLIGDESELEALKIVTNNQLFPARVYLLREGPKTDTLQFAGSLNISGALNVVNTLSASALSVDGIPIFKKTTLTGEYKVPYDCLVGSSTGLSFVKKDTKLPKDYTIFLYFID